MDLNSVSNYEEVKNAILEKVLLLLESHYFFIVTEFLKVDLYRN